MTETADPTRSDPAGEAVECPKCGRRLDSDIPGQLCPYCLLAAEPVDSTSAWSGSGAAANRFNLPEPGELQPFFPTLKIETLIGFGGMGAVYRAKQESLERDVALKVLPPEIAASPGFTHRFIREAQALARLSHPNVVTVFEHGTAGPYAYLIMELVEGVNLRELMAGDRLAPEEALRIVAELCDALQFAHHQGVIHRDIKPENILVDEVGNVKITDFGLAKLASTDPSFPQTRTQQVMGTWHYMAPEQIEQPREVDHRADLYSLGVVFYELLTGELPIGRFPPPSAKAGTGKQVDRVVLRSLEKEPVRRYASAGEFREDLKRRPAFAARRRVAQAAKHVGRGVNAAESQFWGVVGRRPVLRHYGSALLCLAYYFALMIWMIILANAHNDDELAAGVFFGSIAAWAGAWFVTRTLSVSPTPAHLIGLGTPIRWIAQLPGRVVRAPFRGAGKVFGSLDGVRTPLLFIGVACYVIAGFLLMIAMTEDDDAAPASLLFFLLACVLVRFSLRKDFAPQGVRSRLLAYPPILTVVAPITLLMLVWPIVFWYASMSDPETSRWIYHHAQFERPFTASERFDHMRLAVASCATLESAWLLVLASITAFAPGVTRWWFRPFLNGWKGQNRSTLLILTAGTFVLAWCIWIN